MREPSDSDLLTLDQAAQRIGLTDTRRPKAGGRTARAQGLLNAIEAREQATGIEILHRRQRNRRTTIRVTVHALREHLPELFPGTRTRLTEEGTWQRTMGSIDRKIAGKYDPLEGRVTEAERRITLNREMIGDLALRVLALAESEPPTPGPDRPDEKKSA